MLYTFTKFVQFFFVNVYNICYFLCVYNVSLHYKQKVNIQRSFKRKKQAQTKLVNLKEKKWGKRKVTKSKILFITLFMSLFALFTYRKKKRAQVDD